MIYTIAIINHSGKLILARQFTHEDKNQIEGQLSVFPKLVQFSGHAYIDTESVRFVYQDINDLYIVLVVSKDSNIVSDLDSLSFLVDVTRFVAGDINEEKIIKSGLDLIFAYDECVFDGFRQNFSAATISEFLKMDSMEEAEANRIRAEKEARAAAEMKRRVTELEEQRQTTKSSFIPSFVQNSLNNFQQSSNNFNNASIYQPTTVITEDSDQNISSRPSRPSNKGMSLSRSFGSKQKAQQVMAEEGLESNNFLHSKTSNSNADDDAQSNNSSNDFCIALHEKFTAVLSRLDAVREIGVEGRLIASYNRKLSAIISIDNNVLPKNYRYKVMQQPKGRLWQDSCQLIYDNNGPKYGPSSDVTLLCWRMTSTNRDDLPINVSCWIQQGKSQSVFSCDVELKKDKFVVESIEIIIPLAEPRGVNVSSSSGEVEIFERDQYLKWNIEGFEDNNNHAELEFSVPACEDDSFYPISINFRASSTICDVEVTGIEPYNEEEKRGKDNDDDNLISSSPEKVQMPKLEVKKICKTNKFEIE
ncbi:hypothetical protein M9Y10_035202 [Tritrichomonas musculus]|uniref:Coatomer subunit delta n=1 Tax=Tritrichomonas musculus TaxID=1915356 RepID=A0ABR2KH30_9EUKA